MVEVDVEYWDFGIEEFVDCLDCVVVWFGVVGVVGKEDVVWVQCQYFVGWCLCWYYGQVVVVCYQYVQDVQFDVVVVGYYVIWQFIGWDFWMIVVFQVLDVGVLFVVFGGGDFFGQVYVFQVGEGVSQFQCVFFGSVGISQDVVVL